MAKKKFYGSLARRILVICLALIIIPLIFYSAIIWDRDWRIKLDTIFSELTLLGESSLEIYDQWHNYKNAQLENNGSVAQEFPEETKRAFEQGQLVFVHQDEIVVLKRVGDEVRGLSVPGAEWIKLFASSRQFDISVADQNGEFVLSTAKHFDHSDEVAFYLPFKKLSPSEAYSLRNRHLALILPLPDALFTLRIEISREQISQLEGGHLFKRLVEFMVLFIILGGIGAWVLVRRMARPFDQLEHVMDAVEVKDYDRRYREDRFGFEINTLGMKFNEMLQTLLHNMEEAKNERVRSELLLKEFQIGQDVQKELLPKELPQFPGLKVGHGFVPAKEVGGDFYDLFVKDQDQMMIAIADASDKGISACLYSLIVRSLLRSYAESEETLSDTLLQTNNLFYKDAQATSNFVTAWVGFYQVKEKSLTFSSAGHLPAILISPDGMIEELTTQGMALGVTEWKEVEIKTVHIAPGSLLFLYTDGVIDTFNEKGELFGKSRLLDFLKTYRTLEPQQLIDRLVAEVNQFAMQTLQHDDLSILCLKNS